MARKITRETSLDLATTAFWDYGFRGTSMDMLTEVLGVEKPSIYANFGSKKQLFLEALGHYRTTLIGRVSADLKQGISARQGLDRLVRNLMAPSNAQIRRGCLATNSALEMADLDPEIRAHVTATFSEFLALLTRAIRRGQSEGDIRQDQSAGALAQFLISCFGGVRVLEKTGVESSYWLAAARITLSALDHPVGISRRSGGDNSTDARTSVAHQHRKRKH